MADEKKNVAKEVASDNAKAEKKEKKEKKGPSRLSKIGTGIKRFFKDLRGETKKIIWPGRQMVLKSTGIVLAAILVIGAGIWILDFAVSGAVTAMSNAAKTETTTSSPETTEHDEDEAEETDADEDETEETTDAE